MPTNLPQLFAHLVWADSQTFASLSTAPSDRALKLFTHILASENVWLSRIVGEPQRFSPWPTFTIEECRTLADENHRRFAELVASVDDAELARPVNYVTSAGVAGTSTVTDILLHVALHGAYHRGQIAATIREAGGTPASTDYIAFVRGFPAVTPR